MEEKLDSENKFDLYPKKKTKMKVAANDTLGSRNRLGAPQPWTIKMKFN